MQKFQCIISIAVMILLVIPISFISGRVEAGSSWMAISSPVPTPQSGGVFETKLKFFTWDAVIGSYFISVHYDPAILQIIQVTTPDQSPFYGNTFADKNSFTTGTTDISAFQTGTTSEQANPEIFATIQWKALGNTGTSATIELEPKSIVDSFWRPIETNSARTTFVIGDTPSYVPTIIIIGNANKYSPEDTLVLSVIIDNPAPYTQVVDVFLGIIIPNGSAYFFDSSLTNLIPSSLDDPGTFTPVRNSLKLDPGYNLPATAFFSVTLPTGLPEGIYKAFAAFAEPGSVQAGSTRIVGDISIISFYYSP
ncbi:MAG: hypothetical protein A3G93_13320 [Nitrospinae bacterium RIFCSPLOWO2_12_FULL_45_22]|nr:MAG: hypothetical protein A3G93_13320 [Nitrospinae bacterium RIFCSPLOWO2_12_FULL_45_22]